MPVMQMWFWLATDQSLPTAEIFRYQKSEGFVTCFWINPTGSCCWIDRSCKLMGDPKLIARCTSGPMRRMTCCVSARSQWYSSLVATEPDKCNKTRLKKNLRNWTGLMKVCVCFFFFSKNIEVNWEGEKNRPKEVNCGPKQSANLSHWSEDD